jgi:hypothetical protein
VPGSGPISDFVDRAKAANIPDQSVVGILKASGWPEKEIYEALALHYEKSAGIAVPRRDSGGTAARDAFFYLVIFFTLATWTIALGSLSFSLIDQWFSDTLFSNAYASYDTGSVANAIACIIVAFPVYLFASWIVLRQTRLHPEKLNSPVRRWLTYMALVIAAGVFVGDLIDALTTFLRGQVTSRFLADAFVVLLLSGGVFFYYFGRLKKSEESAAEPKRGWDAAMALMSAAVVLVMLVLGFLYSGGPGRQRLKRADDKRLEDLYDLSRRIDNRWNRPGVSKQLPQNLDELGVTLGFDPISHQRYIYRPGQGSDYQLCAVFSLAGGQNQNPSQKPTWSHPRGFYCFQLDASQQTEAPVVSLY